MTTGEQLFLALSIGAIGGFGLWLFYITSRYDRLRGNTPEAKRYEEPTDMVHAGAD
jgi:hypothetical protein